MALKDNLQHIFNSDYPGTDRFINDVIIPVFGDDFDIVNIDQAEKEEYREKATKAGLKKIVYAADIHDEEYRANNIAFFDVTIDNNINVERARVNIQQVIRSIVDHHSHILIVFHYEDVQDKPWRFSYAYKQGSIANTTSAKRYTYVFGRDFRGRTAAECFEVYKKSDHSNKALEEAFSVEALSDEFFDIYRAYYATFVEYITGEKYSDEKKLKNIMNGWNWRTKDTSDQFTTTFDRDAKSARDYIKKMFGRIVFLYFLQRKGWLYDNEGRSDAQYMKHLFDNAGALQFTFLDDVLEILFFYVLNTKPESRISEARMAHKDVTTLPGWDKIPFLNGGLFEQDDIDPKKCTFPVEYFREFFNFLNSYNFTIDENDQEDAEIGIDPEMLGRIFENLLEDNKDKGAFYTPKPIVDYMCRESIIAYLQDDRYKPEGNELIRKFIETLNIDLLNKEQRDEIENKLLKVKICDPAIGSGAFPMGLVNLLSKIFIVLRTYKTIDQAKMKRYIMQQSIYGVDIEKGAVDIARLRFWLAMVVDEPKPTPLPNLHFKIMQGNSLLEWFNGLNLESLMKPSDGELDYITEEERKTLRKDLNRFYSEDDHDKRLVLMNNIKNTVVRMILNADPGSPLSGIDVSETDQFFMWHTWFADVFDNGGFDIVIGNPPYVELNEEEGYPWYETYKCFELYAHFFELGVNLLKPNGILTFITSSLYIKGMKFEKLRNFLKNNCCLLNFRNEGDDVFKEVGMPTSTIIMRISDKNSNWPFDGNEITTKLESQSKSLGSLCDVQRGLEIGKKAINPNGNIRILTGSNVSKFISNSVSYITSDTKEKFSKNPDFYVGERFTIRETGTSLTVTYLDSPILVNRSLFTFKLKANSPSIKYLVACLNSTLLQYYYTERFKAPTELFPKIRIGQAKLLPIRIPTIPQDNYISNIVDEILTEATHLRDFKKLLEKIDFYFYHLYDLTYDEVLIIDPETPITREEYENFKI